MSECTKTHVTNKSPIYMKDVLRIIKKKKKRKKERYSLIA